MDFNIADLFEATVDTVPEREALVVGDQRRTYAELEERANRLAHHFLAQGLGQGDHIGIYAYNCAEWVESMIAAFKIRAVPINVNYRYVDDELQYLFDNADLVTSVVERQFAPRVAALKAEMPKLRHCIVIEDASGEDCTALGAMGYEQALAAGSPERDFEPRSSDDLYIMYTGGTTGAPKGVMWRQHDIIFALFGGIDHMTGTAVERPEELTEKAKAGPGLVLSPIAPLMHLAAHGSLFMSFFTGGKVVLYDGSFSAERVWGLVERERVNMISVTGDATARPLAEALEAPGASYDVSSLIALNSTAAIFSPVVKQQLKRLLPNVLLTEATGATETGFSGIAVVQDSDLAREKKKEGLITFNAGAGTIVLDENLVPVEPGSGVIGKLARSGNIPLGYYKDPEKSRTIFVEALGRRWSIPGDFATVEADGRITMLGRGWACINSGGEKVYPEEVEAALKSHPDVFDVLVIGVPDERWGERVAAVVQARPERTPQLDDLVAHCRDLVAGYKVPRELHLVPNIPRFPTGKPDYPSTRHLALDGKHKV
jgi:acyl-CoA synthetase (AMP-forming)/AMP-acid ligase II